MKPMISELLHQEPIKPPNSFKTSVMIEYEDALFLEAVAQIVGTTRAKLLKKAVSHSCIADYLYLQTSEPEMLSDIMRKVEAMAEEEHFESLTDNKHPIFTTYGLDHAGIVPIYEPKETR